MWNHLERLGFFPNAIEGVVDSLEDTIGCPFDVKTWNLITIHMRMERRPSKECIIHEDHAGRWSAPPKSNHHSVAPSLGFEFGGR